jgi:hypothetical protein
MNRPVVGGLDNAKLQDRLGMIVTLFWLAADHMPTLSITSRKLFSLAA